MIWYHTRRILILITFWHSMVTQFTTRSADLAGWQRIRPDVQPEQTSLKELVLAGWENYSLQNQTNTFDNIWQYTTRPPDVLREEENRFETADAGACWMGYCHKKGFTIGAGSLRSLEEFGHWAFITRQTVRLSWVNSNCHIEFAMEEVRWGCFLQLQVWFLVSGVGFCDGTGSTRGAWLPLYLCQWALQIATGIATKPVKFPQVFKANLSNSHSNCHKKQMISTFLEIR